MSEQERLPGTVETGALPPCVHVIEHSGRQIFLVGTAHVSKQSVVDVRRTVELVRPDVVCVELDEVRYKNLTDPTRWRKTNIGEVIRKGKAMLLLSSLIMTSFQRRIGKKLGVMPGAELLEGVKAAEDVGARVVLADRDIQVTLKRTWRNLGMWDKFKMVTQLTASLFVTEEIDEKTIEELKDTEKLSDVLQLLSDEFPKMKSTLIDERDRYLAQKIGEVEADRIVAVVGAGHVPGILKEVEVDQDLAELEIVPPPSKGSGVFKWAIPGLILALFAYGFLKGGSDESVTSIYIWFLINGSLAAIGAALALGHPLTVISAFLAAPLTCLNPMIAAGWVSGLVQALVKKPTVKDLEELPEAITSVKGFWLNPVSRILLVVVFSNLGSVIGTFVAGSWIAARLIR